MSRHDRAEALGLGKLPPQDLPTEESILGAIMLEADAFDEAFSILTADDFYSDSHKTIFKSFVEIKARNEPIDIRTTVHQLRRSGDLEVVGGAYFVSELTSRVNSSANILTHAAIVKECSIKRQIIAVGQTLIRDGYDHSINAFTLIDDADRAISSVYQDKGGITNISDDTYLLETIDEVSAAKKAKTENNVCGLESGIRSVDRFTGGWTKSDLIIIAGRPGMGKTALVISMIRHMAIFNSLPVAMFSLEMSTKQVLHRLLSQVASIPTEGFRNGDVSDQEFAMLMYKVPEMMGKNIFIDQTPGMSIAQMKSKAKILKKKHDIQVLFVDYIQLAEASDSHKGNREQAISEISRGLKQIAKDLDIPVIALSQLSRAVETRGGDKRPQLSDLRESGSIEQDADIVVFTYRPEYYGIKEDEYGNTTIGVAEMIFAKNRHGATGPEACRFIKKYANWIDKGDIMPVSQSPNLF